MVHVMSEVKSLMFVFDRMPDQDGCTFIEVENAEGQSICAGEWRNRDDGLVELVVPVNYDDAQRLRADTAEAELVSANSDKEAYAQNAIDLRKQVDLWKGRTTNLTHELAAAEQRIAELSADNQQLRKLLGQTLAALNPTAKLSKSILAALNPNPEAESDE